MLKRTLFLLTALMMLTSSAALSSLTVKPEPIDDPLPGVALGLPATNDEQAPPERGADVEGILSSPFYDKDRNRVFDELDRAIAGLGESDRVTAIVLFTHPVTQEDVDQYRAMYGDFPVNALWTVVDGFSADLTAEQVLAFSQRGDVQQIEHEMIFTAQMNGARAWFGVDKAKADFGVNGDKTGAIKTYTKDDVVICVIDTGIYTGHYDLNQGQVIGWKDYVNGKTSPYDDNGHGTHVAGIAAGQGDANSAYRGVAHGAALVGVKVLNSAGSGTSTQIINGIDFCKNSKSTYGIEIISMSLGSSGSSDGTDSISTAANNAWGAGLTVVVAAGNAGPKAYTIGSPAAASKVITVGSMADPGASVKGFLQSSFSSRGPTADGRVKPDISAPGHDITAPKTGTTSSYVTMSGTSMATPFVSGVAALMLDANGGLTNQNIKDKLMATVINWRGAGADIDYGAGRLQAYEAVKSAGGYSGTGPAVPAHHYKYEDLTGSGKSDYYSWGVSSTSYPLALTLIIPGASSSKDFDLYLYNPSGTLVAKSETSARQDQIGFTPSATGTYKVRVYSYAGSGNYHLDFSAGGSPSISTDG